MKGVVVRYRQRFPLICADDFAVFQNNQTVTDIFEILEPMFDDQDRISLRFQSGKRILQQTDRLVIQIG